MKNKKLKGFTLVELLVVIAILAVLATVSVVGYTSFISKANNSNALTECKQAEDIVLSDLISTGKEVDAVAEIKDGSGNALVTFKYSVGSGKVEITKATIDNNTDITAAMKEKFTDLKELAGHFVLLKNSKVVEITEKDADGNDKKVSENRDQIVYVTSNLKGVALWASKESPAALPSTTAKLEDLAAMFQTTPTEDSEG